MAVRRWSWLGDHLAVDLANTVRRRGMRYVELLRIPADLQEWLDLEGPRLLPGIPPRHAWPPFVDEDLMTRVLAVRDSTLDLLRAAALGQPRPAPAARVLDRLAREQPSVRQLGEQSTGWHHRAVDPADTSDAVIALLTAAALDVLTSPALATVALCDAPGCGQLYHRERPNQQWCDPHCGTRARSDRHRRTRERFPAASTDAVHAAPATKRQNG